MDSFQIALDGVACSHGGECVQGTQRMLLLCNIRAGILKAEGAEHGCPSYVTSCKVFLSSQAPMLTHSHIHPRK